MCCNPLVQRRPVLRTLPELCAWFTAPDGPGDAPALADDRCTLTYRDLGVGIRAAVQVLRQLGVTQGDRVVMHGRNSCGWVIVGYAVSCAGAVLVPVTPSAPDAEIVSTAEGCGASLVVTDDRGRARGLAGRMTVMVRAVAELLDRVDGIVDSGIGWGAVTSGDIAVVLGTAGTTGVPKAVPLRHGALLRCYTEVAERLAILPTDRLLGVVPLAHSFGFGGVLLTGLLAGAAIRLVPRYRAADIAAMLRFDAITVACGPPTLFADLIDRLVEGEPAADAGRLRLIVTGGSDVPPDRLADWAHRLGDPDVVVGYGMTEATGTIAMTDRRPGHQLGRATVPGMSVLDGVQAADRPRAGGCGPGRRGCPCSRLQRRRGRRRHGWFATGDLGYIDATGLLHITGRATEAVVVSGYQVHPGEVERVLTAFESVAEAVVFGVPDVRTGQQLVACVTPRSHHRPDPGALALWCRERLAAYKVPRRIVVVDVLPTTEVGKRSRTAVSAALRDAGLL